MKGEHVEENFLENIGQTSFDTDLYKIVTINPVEFANYKTPQGDMTILESFQDCAEDWQKELVKIYRKETKNPNSTIHQRLIIIEDDMIWDGHHRLIAFALENITQLKAVDISKPK